MSGVDAKQVVGQLGRYRPYPEYKDSGVEWLGEIPAHWELGRLKHLCTVDDEALSEDTDPDLEIVYVDIGNVDASAGIVAKERYSFADAPSRARRIVRHGDVIVSTVRTYLKAIAPIVDPEPNLVVSTGFAVVRPRHLDFWFAAYALRAPYFVDRVVADSVGVSYPAINAPEMACFPVACPTLDEQRAIAAFLDRETAKIDALVAKKQWLIELLQEKRTALISHTVTKGLDPNAPMKASGVEWLGEIPAHWGVDRLKWTVTVCQNGIWGEEPDGLSDIACVRVADFDRVRFRVKLKEPTMRSVPPTLVRSRQLRSGNLLLEKSGGGEQQPVGAVVLFDGDVPAVCSNFIARMVVADGVTPAFLCYVHAAGYSARLNIPSIKQNTGIQNLDSSAYLNERCPFPPPVEQRSIAAFLDRETARIDALAARVREGIDRLKEYRTALISAAVTGKINVREVASQPPPTSGPA